MKTTLATLIAFAAGSAYASRSPLICMSSPVATIGAGQRITANIENPHGKTCLATLIFPDENFLPVIFALPPIQCLGFQQAEIVVPLEAPNGLVTILWDCAGGGALSCSRAMISGGTADSGALSVLGEGFIECVNPVATITTLLTSTRGSSTVVLAVAETLFSTTTPGTPVPIATEVLVKSARPTSMSSSTYTPSTTPTALEQTSSGMLPSMKFSTTTQPAPTSTSTGIEVVIQAVPTKMSTETMSMSVSGCNVVTSSSCVMPKASGSNSSPFT